MKAKHKPKVWFKHEIKYYDKIVGYIHLVDYLTGKATPHIEYHIDEKYRNRGLLTRELPKYLKQLKKDDIYQLIAITMQDNAVSKRLLENNGFIKVKDIGDNTSYIIDLRLTPDIIESMINKVNQSFNIKKY